MTTIPRVRSLRQRALRAFGRDSLVKLSPYVLGLALVCAPLMAQAQPSDLDALRKRFTAAIALEEKEDWAAAKKEFEEIGKIKMTAQVRFHIALCSKGLGRFATALREFEAALQLAEADPENNADVITNARDQIAELEPKAPRVKLIVEDAGVAQLTLDDDATTLTARGSLAMRVDPGSHLITVQRAGKAPFTRKFNAEEGSLTEFSIPESSAPVAEVVVPPPPPQEVTTVEPGDVLPAVVVGATGVALLVGAGVFLGLRQATIGEIEEGCLDKENLDKCDPAKVDAAAQGEIWNGLTWGLGAAGVAGVGVGVALFFTVGQDQTVVRKGPVSVSVGPASVYFEIQLL